MNLENTVKAGISYYICKEIEKLGVIHGFCDASIDFRQSEREASKSRFCSVFGLKNLLILNQTHSADFVLLDKTGIENYRVQTADALIIKNFKSIKKYAIGILSADCLPILFIAGDTLALVHSGWRGLANGIIQKVLNEINQLSGDSVLCSVIGPAAGPALYEVGEEVIKAIGVNAVYIKNSETKYMLSLTGTAQKIINDNYRGNRMCIDSGICVISNNKFFSHRRQQSESGRNMSFVIF